MALGPKRQIFETDISFQVNTVAERGGVLSVASGTVIDVSVASYAASPSGARPIGVLLDDVEGLNAAKHPEYRQRNVVPIGSVIGIVTRGIVKTDFIPSDLTGVVKGDPAYLYTNGTIVTRAYVLSNGGQVQDGTNTSATAAPRVGRFESPIDGDRFVEFYIDAVN